MRCSKIETRIKTPFFPIHIERHSCLGIEPALLSCTRNNPDGRYPHHIHYLALYMACTCLSASTPATISILSLPIVLMKFAEDTIYFEDEPQGAREEFQQHNNGVIKTHRLAKIERKMSIIQHNKDFPRSRDKSGSQINSKLQSEPE